MNSLAVEVAKPNKQRKKKEKNSANKNIAFWANVCIEEIMP